ncbi:hypothetical protein CRENBAI_003906 [Crenichthys baileyi]|uniref:Uncharacterized protein n=1 Tax=Crenichthys baileyi TaxID=28760 RepID=A0AAV9QUF1_9TELE
MDQLKETDSGLATRRRWTQNGFCTGSDSLSLRSALPSLSTDFGPEVKEPTRCCSSEQLKN